MNHLKARQLQDTGQWQYTCKNDGRIWPMGSCGVSHVGHDTPEAAESCYKNYLLGTNLLLDGQSDIGYCKVCNAITTGFAEIPQAYWGVQLCDEHRNRNEVGRLFTVGESWQS